MSSSSQKQTPFLPDRRDTSESEKERRWKGGRWRFGAVAEEVRDGADQGQIQEYQVVWGPPQLVTTDGVFQDGAVEGRHVDEQLGWLAI